MPVIELNHEISITEKEIQDCVRDLGARITKDYEGRDLVVIGILKGSVIFLSDLIRAINLPLKIDFMSISSYGSEMKSSGVVRLLYDLNAPIEGKDVLLVEDIIDTGLTLNYLVENLATRHPKSIKVCVLLDKKEARKPDNQIQVEYVGFEVPNKFLVGYGLDFNENYRNLPYIAAVTD
ncbi:MAG: hypoxanthine phosphoribosyltransferase [Candidatus Cloacimonetes bacterium 4572_55]|nr:MAG: hypoxanthine phosphoribosyltransferase [Candidatus Cloacimonetes bacterium 4572_55]